MSIAVNTAQLEVCHAQQLLQSDSRTAKAAEAAPKKVFLADLDLLPEGGFMASTNTLWRQPQWRWW